MRKAPTVVGPCAGVRQERPAEERPGEESWVAPLCQGRRGVSEKQSELEGPQGRLERTGLSPGQVG